MFNGMSAARIASQTGQAPEQQQGSGGSEGPQGVPGQGGGGTAAPAGIEAGEEQEIFLELMVEQMKHQNPLDPMKNQQFIQQLASFNTVEQITNLNDNIRQMLGGRQLLEANALVGRHVEGVDAQGNVISGEVQRVERIDGTITLKVGDGLLMLDQVNEVAASEEGLAGEESPSSGEEDSSGEGGGA